MRAPGNMGSAEGGWFSAAGTETAHHSPNGYTGRDRRFTMSLSGTGYVFETERLVARPWDPEEDAAGAFVMYGDPEVVRYIGNQLVPDVDAQRIRLAAIVERWAPFEGRFASWPVFEKATGELVGTSLLKPVPASGTQGALSDDIEIGWHVARRHWGRGFATETGRALVVRAFEVLGLERIHAVVEPPNQRSQRVALKIGMQHRGRTDRYYDQELEHFELFG
jgi:[ribosomal protein S5]-alanine N-acetyltransferase